MFSKTKNVDMYNNSLAPIKFHKSIDESLKHIFAVKPFYDNLNNYPTKKLEFEFFRKAREKNGENFYEVFDGWSTDWMVTNIFHVSQSDLFELRWQGELSHRFYLDGSLDSDYKYYASIGGIGGPSFVPNIVSVKYDGSFFYLITESYLEDYWDEYSGPHYSIMGYEKIDGVYYWTLYYFTEEIPSDY